MSISFGGLRVRVRVFLVLTGISEVEVILDVAGDVVAPFVLYPASCVWLLVIADENSKKNNHSDLPDKADGRQANPNVGVLPPAEKTAHALTTVPHGADSPLLMMLLFYLLGWSSTVARSGFSADAAFIRSPAYEPVEGLCPDSPLTGSGWTYVRCMSCKPLLLPRLSMCCFSQANLEEKRVSQLEDNQGFHNQIDENLIKSITTCWVFFGLGLCCNWRPMLQKQQLIEKRC